MLKKLVCLDNKHIKVFIQGIFIFCWMVSLLRTDAYYTAYIICGILSVISLAFCYKNQGPLQKAEKIIIAIASSLFSAAVLLSNYNIFLPLKENLFGIAVTFVGGLFVAGNILIFFGKKFPIKQTEQRKATVKNRMLVFAACFGFIAVVDLVYLFTTAYPGTLTPDSIAQMEQILNGYTSNHHPFFHTVVISVFLKLGLVLFGNMNAAVATYSVALVLFMAGCFAYAVTTLYRAGVSKGILIIILLLYSLTPYHIAYSVTMWKDVVFGGAVLVFTTTLFKLLKNIGSEKLNRVILFFSCIAVCVWRSNGWLAMVGAALLFSVFFSVLKKKHIITTVILCAAIVLSWFMCTPLISMLNIKQPDLVESLSIPVQQVARVITSGKELTPEQTELISKIVDIEEIPTIYEEYISDPIKNEIRSKDNQYFEDHKGEYLKLWITLGIKYPKEYIAAWVDQTRGYYNAGYSYWIYTTGVNPNDFSVYSDITPTPITKIYTKYFDAFFDSAVLQPLVSIGLNVWLLCGLLVINLIKKKEEWVLYMLPVMIVGTLLIATPVFSEFRYVYAVFTTLPFLTAVGMTKINTKKDN